MSERAQRVMNAIWENKLTAAILRIVSENVIDYTAQNELVVLDKNDLLSLASEIESL